MQVCWLTDRQTGEMTLVDADTVERLLGVEIGHVEWCIRVDGVFENEGWRIRLAKNALACASCTDVLKMRGCLHSKKI